MQTEVWNTFLRQTNRWVNDFEIKGNGVVFQQVHGVNEQTHIITDRSLFYKRLLDLDGKYIADPYVPPLFCPIDGNVASSKVEGLNGFDLEKPYQYLLNYRVG